MLAVTLGWLLGLDSAGVLGILSGATTNTPSLGASQQAVATVPGISDERQALPALAYAVTYPAAIAGTGRGGRITKGDALAALEARAKAPAPAPAHSAPREIQEEAARRGLIPYPPPSPTTEQEPS